MIQVFDRLLLHIEQIKSNDIDIDIDYKFFICSDFNARVGELKDFVAGDNSRYIDALPDDYISDTELKRVSED